jgi:hypothetical protein
MPAILPTRHDVPNIAINSPQCSITYRQWVVTAWALAFGSYP